MKALLKVGILVVMFAMLSGAALAQDTKTKKKTETESKTPVCILKVDGMTCGGCATGVQQALLKVPGVTKATVDYETRSAKVEYDADTTGPKKILKTRLGPGQSITLAENSKKKPETKNN